MKEKGKVIEFIDAELEPLIPKFMSNTRRELEEMRNALAADAFDEVRRLGHSTKGAGFGYGFANMGELGKSIEQAALGQDRSICSRCLEEFADYLNRLEIRYE